jgi:uncharacterized iron-regulated protein
MTRRLRSAIAVATLTLLLGGCATRTDALVERRLDSLLPADAILLGEQHDADAHRDVQRAFVRTLAERGKLAALVLEMADRGRSTAALARDASAAQVQASLHWDDAGWPWARYAPVVMAAVRKGVPVLGGNLPRAELRQRMNEPALDQHLDGPALARQREAIRIGHCDLLPAARLMPMVRVQLARDASMAATVMDARISGKTVLLVAGNGHVLREIGIPTHLPKDLRVRTVQAVAGSASSAESGDADMLWLTAPLPPRDHCAELRKQFGR